MNPNRSTTYIPMKMLKDKKRILKAEKRKQLVIYKEIPIKISADFSEENLQARRERYIIFKVMTR